MKTSEEKLRQLIREELLSEIDASWTHTKTDEEDEDPGDPHTDYWEALKTTSLNPADWWKTYKKIWSKEAMKDSPGKQLVHDMLSDLEYLPGFSIAAGPINSMIHHARGEDKKAGLSLLFSFAGAKAFSMLYKAAKNPGRAQKIFAPINHQARKLAGMLKGDSMTLLRRNADAAAKTLAAMTLFTPAVGETAEDAVLEGIRALIPKAHEVWEELQKSQQVFDTIVDSPPPGVHVSPDLVMTTGEGVAENRDAVLESVIKRLLSED